MTQDEAAILYSLIDKATEGNWPRIAEDLLEEGYSLKEVCRVVNGVCKVAGMSPMLEEDDF